ncbi:MAG TPA: CheR family methyltransferase, partial [Pyrinomonadaceae bacterium]|nr:CheR family methyltransferase [Pyrinomonadaceae bacterium]
ESADEAQSLLKDLLISVTNFFRDKEAFAYLETEVLPRLLDGKKSDDGIRVWVAGCATGEEAYSIAMLLAERALGGLDAPEIQIFASDIDAAAIAKAREGLYTLNDAADVTPERLRRFFTKEAHGFRVRRELREMVLFANHNVIKDPPFSHLDLVSCRNMMIYLNGMAQERVMEVMHFALNPGGYLFLGSAESVDGAGDLYAPVSREHHIFQSRPVAARLSYPVPDSSPSFRFEQKTLPAITTQEQEARALERITYGDLHQQLLEQYAPPSVVVNEEYDIVHLSERAGKYMRVAGGEPSNNLLKVIRPELRLELRSALYQAVGRRTNLEVKNLIVQSDGRRETINIHVRPVLRPDDAARGFLLVLFEPATGAAETSEAAYSSPEPVARQIEEELMKVRAQLRSSSEQHELHAEELKASNEELQAMNEELRSAAEELETSTEELQSVNEELTTVNQELKIKVEEITQVNNDFQNLINSTDIGTVFLDRSFRVNLFTPAASRIFNLIPADFGRPISDITHRLETDGLLHDAETVLDTLQTIEREARTNDGRTYLLRVLPYRTTEDRINGVVASFIDITERKRAEEAKFFLASIVESSKDSIITINLNGTITSWNNGAEWLYGYAANEAVGKPVTMLTLPEDLKQVLANIERIRHSQKVEVYDTVRTHKDGHEINLEIVLSPVKDDKGEVIGASTVARDVTGRKRAEANLAFLAEVSQDLVQLTSVRETMNSLGAKIAEHFKVARVAFAEISGDEKTSVIRHEWRQAGLPSLEAASQLKDIFALKPELAQRDGEISYISDVAAVRPDAAQTYTALGIASFLGAPLARDGKWRIYLNILDSEPREWRADELELIRELTSRIRTRLERARAEEALLLGEAQLQVLLDETPMGVYLIDEDFRIGAVNPIALPVFGEMPDLIGRDFDEVIHWLWSKEYADEVVRLFRHTL